MLSLLLSSVLLGAGVPAVLEGPADASALAGVAQPAPVAPGRDSAPVALPLAFVSRLGGHDPAARYVARLPALTAFVGDGALTLALHGDAQRPGAALTLRWQGAGGPVRPVPAGRPLGPVRSYRGADPSRWDAVGSATDALRLPAVAPGVDVLLHERDGLLSYDLLLEPGADLAALSVGCEGVQALCLEGESLRLETAAGALLQTAPVAWSLAPDGSRRDVAVSFRLLGEGRFGFVAADRDPSLPLVVDPGLVYGSAFGGSGADGLAALALDDGSGHLLVTGSSTSHDLPVTAGAQQPLLVGLSDVLIARLDPAAGQLVWATYLGGTDTNLFRPELGQALALAADGTLVVAGTANSSDFPTTAGVFQPAGAGAGDAFVARLDGDGGLLWSTRLGGQGNDEARALALADDGAVVVVGATFSNNFPTTPGAFDQSFNSLFLTNDLFVSRLAADGSALQWSTYVGGSLRDEASDVLLDAQGRPVVVGLSGSPDFPVTAGAYDESFNGGGGTETDAVALRLSADGSALQWATYLGSAEVTAASAVVATAGGDLVLAGTTQGADFPTTAGAHQRVFGGGVSDAFVCGLSADGSVLQWSTFLGGGAEDMAADLALDAAGQPTLVGRTRSGDFIAKLRPLLPGGGGGDGPAVTSSRAQLGGVAPAPGAPTPADLLGTSVDGVLDGLLDAFVARLSPTGAAVLWASLHGGAGSDEAHALVLDDLGAAWVVGDSDSADLPVTPDGYDTTPNGSTDGFLARFAVPPFEDLGFGLEAAPARVLRLRPGGRPARGGQLILEVGGARPGAALALVLAHGDGASLVLPGRANSQGQARWSGAWPAGLPVGSVLEVLVLGPGGAASRRLAIHGLD